MVNILNISGTEIKDSGIRKLAEYVKANLQDSTLIIGCKPSIYDVDAILIHKNNIFAIECKDWKGTITGGSYGWWQKDGQVIENPLQQARNNAVALGKWLRTKLKNVKGSIWVQGILLFTHEDCRIKLNIEKSTNTGVLIMQLDNFKKVASNTSKSKKDNSTNQVINYFKQYDQKDNLLRNKQYPTLGKELMMFSIISLIVLLVFQSGAALFYIVIFNLFYFLVIRNIKKSGNFNYNEIIPDDTDKGLGDAPYYDPSFDDLGSNIHYKDD